MAKVIIKDFLIQMGFDSTAVDKGLKKVEKDVKSFSTTFVGLAKKQQTNNSKILKGVNAVNAAKAKQLALDKKLGQSAGTTIIQGGGGIGTGAARGAGNQAGPDRRRLKQLRDKEAQIAVDARQRQLAQVGPTRKDARRLKATHRANSIREEAAAHAENNKRIRDGISLADKKMMIQADLDRRLQAIGHKYGHNNKELQESAKHMTTNSKEASSFVRNVSQAQNEIKRMKGLIEKTSDPRMLKRLNQEIKDLAASNKRLNQSLDTQAKKMTASKFAADGLRSSVSNLARGYASVFAIMAGGGAALQLGQDLIASKATLLGASGDARQAAEDFEFLQQTSERLGTSLRDSVGGYAKIGAAARSAGLGVSESRNMFLAAQETAAAFQLSADDTAGVQRAFSQILAKGKLSTEELLQIGST